MAHYAILNEDNVVINVVTGRDDDPTIDWENVYGGKKTSYNTKGGVYYNPETGMPHSDQSKLFRKNYAGVGYTYDPERDAFIPPKPYESWTLNEQTCLWEAPTPRPEDGKKYYWHNKTQEWVTKQEKFTRNLWKRKNK
jgi:hypothetical protein